MHVDIRVKMHLVSVPLFCNRIFLANSFIFCLIYDKIQKTIKTSKEKSYEAITKNKF